MSRGVDAVSGPVESPMAALCLPIGHRAAKEAVPMIHWALVFFVIALIAAALGLRGVAGMSAQIGYFFVVLAVVFLLIAVFTGRTPVAVPGP